MTYGHNSYKGKFIPQNPKKYNGNPENIIYRSSWELRCMKWFDDKRNIKILRNEFISEVDREFIRVISNV